MDNEEFIKDAKRRLFYYLHPNKQNKKPNTAGMFVVWLSKIGKNNKCLIGIEDSNDYFEISHFGDEDEFALDHYALKKHYLI